MEGEEAAAFSGRRAVAVVAAGAAATACEEAPLEDCFSRIGRRESRGDEGGL